MMFLMIIQNCRRQYQEEITAHHQINRLNFKNVIDFGSNNAYVTVSYDGGQTAEFTGKIGDSTGSLGGINFSSSHGYARQIVYC